MSPTRIMIAENEGLVARDMELMVKSLGYEVAAVVSSGEEALARAVEEKPDLILMDIVLKGPVDGIEASLTLWEKYHLPVIYVTAYADDAILKRARLTEPFGYILKPFDERELKISIEIALFKSAMERKLREREEWLSALLKNVKEAVIATDEGSRVTYLNPFAEQLVGWAQGEALGRPLEEILRPAGPALEDLDRVREVTLFHKEGRSFPAEVQRSTFGRDEEVAGSIVVVRDISERRRSESEIRQGWSKLRQALEGAIRAVASTIEIKDQYTAGHQRRVSKLSCAIARELGLPVSQVEGIKVAGDIHDIGKIYVPTEILTKPGGLTAEEFAIIKMHPQLGYDILRKIDFPWPIATIVLQHHERIDGSGYPAGLKKGDILIEARIVSVSDTVEAMSSHRPYRPALSFDDVLAEISRNRGRFYDAEVAEVCLRLLREKNVSVFQEDD
jgi:PAS domain S-box-containing protein/putative nucleotidyltransferase with HDIG domain